MWYVFIWKRGENIPKQKNFDQGAYIQEYMKRHYKRLQILLNTEEDADIIAWLNRQPNKSAYIKKLVREDMEK